MASGNPKPAFYLAVLAVVLALVGLALWRLGALPGVKSAKTISKDEMATATEAPDSSGITTSKEYKYVPAAKLPPVQGISSYKPLAGSHGSFRDQRVGGLGSDHFRQQRVQGGEDLEDSERKGFQSRADPDRRSGGDARRLRGRECPHRMGDSGYGSSVHGGSAARIRA